MKNKIKLQLHIYRGKNKNSYFFTLGSFGDEYHIQCTKLHQHDYWWAIEKLKNDYGLIFPKNFKDNFDYESDEDFNETVTLYKDNNVKTKEELYPLTRL